MAKDSKPKTKNYKLIARQHTGAPDLDTGVRVEYTEGDMVPLTEAGYAAFGDKFEAPKDEKDEPENSASLPSIPNDSKNNDTVDPIKDADKTKPSGTATGAGAAANSTNTTTVK